MLKERYRLSARLIRAIRRSPLSLNTLGFDCGLQSSHLSLLLSGHPFGDVRKARVERLAAKVGIAPEHATVKVSR